MHKQKIQAFVWNEQFLTGLPEVDKQHQKLVKMTNKLGRHLSKGEEVDEKVMNKVIKKLARYAQYHFEEEEGLMAEMQIDARHFSHHRTEHERFLNEVLHLKESMSNRALGGEQALFKFLTHWLAYHILGDDQVMGRQIKLIREGLSPELAYDQVSSATAGATGPLLKALNGLFKQVSERNRKLVELNRSLEEKVQERTMELLKLNQHLDELAHSDSLTGLPNRRHAMNRLGLEWIKSQEHPLLCMMIDADGFKGINDSFGHDAGDKVLRELAKKLTNSIRTDDFVARLGGDEFMILLPNTPPEKGVQIAGKILKSVNKMKLKVEEGHWQGSVSIGLAVASETMQDKGDLLKLADKAVYLAKRNGRNRLEYLDTADSD